MMKANFTLPEDMKFGEANILAILAYSIMFILGFTTNSLSLFELLREKFVRRKCSRMSLLFTHLCAADLIVILIQVPLEIVWTATVSWFAGDFMCRIMVLLRIFGFYLSGFVMIVISLDRLSAILYPISHRSSTARTKLMLGVSWVLSLLCSLPQCFVFRLKKHPIQDDYLQCTTFGYFENRDMELLFFIFVFTLTWVLP